MKGNPLILSDEEALAIINIRYTMSFTEYTKYKATTVASHVSDETVADILSIRQICREWQLKNPLSAFIMTVFFCLIIGYTG